MKLADLKPEAVAAEVCAAVVGHIRQLASGLSPSLADRVRGADAKGSDLELEVEALTGYAQRGLPVWDWKTTGEVSDAMLSVLSALHTSAGSPEIEGGILDAPEDADPDSAIGVVLLAARGRWRLDDGKPIPSREIAALAGIRYQSVKDLGVKGEIAIAGGEVRAKEARRWLGARGVPGFGDR